MKSVNPKRRIIHAVTHGAFTRSLGELHNSAETERTQSGIIKGRGTSDIRDSNASVVDHARFLFLVA
jgi:hypothetical protein